MSHGIQVFKPSGALSWESSGGVTGLIYVETVLVSDAEQTIVRTLSDFPGRTGVAHAFSSTRMPAIVLTWTSPGGVPSLSIYRRPPSVYTGTGVIPVHIYVR